MDKSISTDRQTERQTDRITDMIIKACPRKFVYGGCITMHKLLQSLIFLDFSCHFYTVYAFPCIIQGACVCRMDLTNEHKTFFAFQWRFLCCYGMTGD